MQLPVPDSELGLISRTKRGINFFQELDQNQTQVTLFFGNRNHNHSNFPELEVLDKRQELANTSL
jgi:hypothetical protein